MKEKKGYQFVGWYIDKECTKRLNPGGKLPHSMTLYDKWVPILYPITYELDGGINSRKNPRFVTIDSGVVLLYPPRKKDKIFEGWYLNDKKVSYIPECQDKPITLVAKYKDLHVVEFETFGGATVQKQYTNEDKKLDKLISPMRMGYKFKGWCWDKNLRWHYTLDQEIENDCTLFAKWEVETYTIEYVVDGGFAPRSNPKTYTYFDNEYILKPASKKGYKFVGWFDERNNELKTIFQNSMGNKKLFAHFEKD